jgi:Holliday junction resolvase
MRGVFLVAAELAERGFIVSPTSRSARGVDLLATNFDGAKTFAIEVKSASRSTFWIVGKDAGKQASRNNVWVFVKFGKEKERSRFFVVPSRHLRRFVNPGKTMPFVKRNAILKYEDRWSAFGVSAFGP